MDISRRSFLKGSAAGALLLALSGAGLATASAEESKSGLKPADQTYECDVLVVGLGASGLMAACGAAAKGANVIAVDATGAMLGTTNIMTSGAWAVGSRMEMEEDPNPSTVEDAFKYYWSKTHYQTNAKVLRNLLAVGGRAIDMLLDAGMTFTNKFKEYTDPTSPTYMDKNRHFYGFKGADRAVVFEKMLEDYGVNAMFDTKAESVIMDGERVAGLQCAGKDSIIDIKAKAVILCSGGFLDNPELVAKYYGGAYVLPLGNGRCDGAAVRIAEAAGAQMGKNYSLCMNEYGGANPKTAPSYAFRHNINENETLRLPVLGGLLVDQEGNRFVNEGIVCEEAMFTGEPMIRDSHFYGVYDTAFINKVAVTPLLEMMETERMNPNAIGALTGITDTDIVEHLDRAIEEGWCFKADTIEELAEKVGLANLTATVKEYNGYCEAGHDDQFYKNPLYLNSVSEGPFYVAEYVPSAWNSTGGVKTDGWCRALTASNHVVKGLYVAGCAADIHSVPYFQGGSLNGFALSSGLLAGETAVEDIKEM